MLYASQISTSPVLLLSLIGFRYFLRSSKNEAILFLVLILTEVGIVSLHKTVLTRHITTILPYVFVPVVFVVERSFGQMENADNGLIKRYWLFSLVFILSLLSAARVFHAMNTYWGRSISSPFTFAQETPSYILFYCSLFLVFEFLYRLRGRTKGLFHLLAFM